MSSSLRRPVQVLNLVTGLRQQHVELTKPLTWHGVQRIMARERIRVIRCPVPGGARVLSRGGVSVIALDSNAPARHHTGLLAHEWGHILLHADDGDEVTRQVMVCHRGDPRELEAKLFARLLLLGPGVGLDDAAVAPLADKLVRAGRQLAMPLEDRRAAPAPKADQPPPARTPVGVHPDQALSSTGWAIQRAAQIRKVGTVKRWFRPAGP